MTSCRIKTFCRYVHPKVLVRSLIAGSRYAVMSICLSVNKNRCFKAKWFMESSWTNATLQRPRQVFLLKSENKFLIKCSTYHAHLVMRNEIIKKGKKEKKEGQKLCNTMCFSKEQVAVMKLEHVNKTLYALYADWNDKTVSKQYTNNPAQLAHPAIFAFWSKKIEQKTNTKHSLSHCISEINSTWCCSKTSITVKWRDVHNSTTSESFYRSRISQTAMNQLRKPAF